MNQPSDLGAIMTRFAERVTERGIPYDEALADALDTWLTQDQATEEYLQTEEARTQCGGAIILDDLPPAVAEQLRAVVEQAHETLHHARTEPADRERPET